MTFSPAQIDALKAPLDRGVVASRNQAGRSLSYVESWHVIAEANRIFGFDGWSSETLECKCVSERETTIGQQKRPGWRVSYTARVRVTVYAGDRTLIREGIGAGHGIDQDLGQAHESAIKEAESDAQKRSLRQFGWPFGLALYDKRQEHVSDGLDGEREHVAQMVAKPLQSEPAGRELPGQSSKVGASGNGDAPAASPPPAPKTQPQEPPAPQRPSQPAPQPPRQRRHTGDVKATAQPNDRRLDKQVSMDLANKMMGRLQWCASLDSLKAWDSNDGMNHLDWKRITLADQKAVERAYRTKKDSIAKTAQAKAAGADPDTGELIDDAVPA